MREIVKQAIERIVNEGQPFSSTDLANAAGITRQAVHRHLLKLLKAGTLKVTGKARAARYQRVTQLHQRLEVATAGSAYRLSARLLMMDVEAGHVTLDFTGVVELGEEFLEELFLVWAPAHPQVTLRLVHLPAKFAPQFFDFAKKQRGEVGANRRVRGLPG
ncbi:MAG: helix-turn-helix domain-containing protein [Archangium sp.]|nr:helix-turn-helix domain-containing protein [Archangium sp.]